MTGKRLSTSKASRILELYALNGLNKTQISKALNISRGTVFQYVCYYEQSDLTYTDLLLYSNKAVIDTVYPKHGYANTKEKSNRLTMLFPALHERLITGDANLKQLWTEYYKDEPSGYKYSHFVYKYHEWHEINNIKGTKRNKWEIDEIEPEDLKLLNKWRLSTDRRKWEKAVALLGLHNGENITDISRKRQ